ncbi:MAG: AAA family ATPase [Bryobacterales bacterium]|nr:AAA family ATPase [Bryobacterales bacterium]
MGRILPIGVQSFRKLRQEGRHYVDKTAYAKVLVEAGTHYFLSRPRRFGKSLLVSTLHSLFSCERDLFEGLAIEPHWNWSLSRPVVHLDLSGADLHEPVGLRRSIFSQLRSHERRFGVVLESPDASERLAELLEALHEGTGRRVVVLIDEYDKPILDMLDDPEIARANRNYLRDLYAVIKRCDEHVGFCFLTGVSKFSKVSLFSGLNNLEDITLTPRFSSICGYTESDLDAVFAAELKGLDRDRLREWYNGYSWGGEERVYNPFDVLLLLKQRQFRNWWCETGNSTFLVNLLLEKGIRWYCLDDMVRSEELLSQFDVGAIAPEALLFQAGYLTVLERLELADSPRYRLGYPNREVRQSLNRDLLSGVLGAGKEGNQESQAARLREVLAAGDLAGLEAELRAFLAGVPHQWHSKNPMGSYEGWYASLLQAYFVASEAQVQAEESGSQGRADLIVRGFGRVYVFELKLRERSEPGAALRQLKERRYADHYLGRGEPVHLVGLEFSAKTRNLTRFEAETV